MSTTPPNFSNFISDFSGSSNIDIVSSVSGQATSSNSGYARYFCIGDLLIQFNDNQPLSNQPTTSYVINFPIPYDATPYTVMLTATNNNNNTQVTTTLKTFGQTNFTFEIDTNIGWVNFVAIGPRPASLYTA